MADKKKKSLMDQLLDIGLGTVEAARAIPQMIGTGALAGAEGLVSGFDFDDREGIPFWNPEEAREGLYRGAERYNWQPKSESGKASSEALMKGMEIADKPFEMFGEGIEGVAEQLGASPEVAGNLGEGSYWLTSLGLGPVKGATSLARKGAGALADKSQIHRAGWYSGGGGRNPVAQALLPTEMVVQGVRQGFSPAEKANYRTSGMSRKSQQAIDDVIEKGDDITNKDRRNVVSDYSNQYIQKVMYDPDNPAIAGGTPLSLVNKSIFPHRTTTTFEGINNDPAVLSKALGLDVKPEVARHIAPRIGERFTRIQDGKPVVLAHRVEGKDVTGQQMTMAVHTAPLNPKNGVGHAWDNLMTRNEPITSDSLLAEIRAINARGDFDGKKPYPEPKNIRGGDGLISWEYALNAGPDPLTASIDIVSVFNPRTGRIFEMSMDRMAPGVSGIANQLPLPAGLRSRIGSAADATAEAGLKNHWISLTPNKNQSIPKKYLEKHGLDDASLIEEVSSTQNQNIFNTQGKLTKYGNELKAESLEGFGESLVTGDVPKAPTMMELYRSMSTPKPNIEMMDWLPLAVPTVTSARVEKKRRERSGAN